MSGRAWREVLVLGPESGREGDEWAGACASALASAGSIGAEELAPRDGRTALVAYFSIDTIDAPGRAARALEAEGVPGEVAGEGTLEDPGWVEAFNASLGPVDVGRRFTILPRGGEPGPGRLALRVEPGRAFGTGHHGSTRLALGWLEDVVVAGAHVLDAGTGTGILAAAAAALGAARVVAFDADPEAVEVASQNLAGSPVALSVADAPPPGERFDVVVANIVLDVILGMLEALLAATRPGGTLVLSGLLSGDEAAVDDALARLGLRADWSREGEWSSARVRT